MEQIFGEGTTSFFFFFFKFAWQFLFSAADVIFGGVVLRLRGGPAGHAGLRRPVQRKSHHWEEVTVAHRERHARHGGQVQRPRHASQGSYKCLSPTSNVL